MQNGIFAFRNVYIIRYLKLGRIEIGKNIGAFFCLPSNVRFFSTLRVVQINHRTKFYLCIYWQIK